MFREVKNAFETVYALIKMVGFLLFCFIGGGALILYPVLDRTARIDANQVSLRDIYPGLLAVLAGSFVVALLLFLPRHENPK